MKRPAKKRKVNKGILGAVGAAVVGVAAGAAAMFLSEKKNRMAVKRTVNSTVRKGKREVVKAEKTLMAAKKKLVKK
jgi:hypothetical protein